ncbi:MAG TPA: voltage-gated chloride channel family protein [Niabella sp.]|nr:voltage-gated chloride channel family protein [Niabella sp.]HOZ97113.1 voltage-gated chloride channel family protein [Niabella sp.]HQW15313.1 voltage-gated chloride channel family protein [Niabella sp.]HQX20437.1 voltage-gated chloride channel family protein [Niabella sp.]HQX42480.1 voltage-gated chloride channel family protein [Niabella sp.]
MKKYRSILHSLIIFPYLIKWTLLAIPVALLAGSMVALFLWCLDKSIDTRFAYPWLLFLLPLAGVFIHYLYKFLGKNAESGNNLIIDEIHEPGGGVPYRMAPLVLVTTLITHLFGGSAGREGTAVQMGGSLAQWVGDVFKLSKEDVRTLLMMGISAGFGAVFGTPVAGAIFALEVLYLGKIKYDALLPCFIASVLANIVCGSWGITHTNYEITFLAKHSTDSFLWHVDSYMLLISIIAGMIFGLAGLLFTELCHSIKNLCNRWFKIKWLIPFTGGCIIISLTYIIGTQDYLSLGVTNPDPNGVSILSSFKMGGADSFSWLWKILFTAITLGTGFKGGEVTPLFFIGATLGNTIASLTGTPTDLLAGLGFIAVFAGATNTPIACTIMGVELFGGDNIIYFAIACFTAYYFSGHSGIYSSQRIGQSKFSALRHHTNKTLNEIRKKRLNKKEK